MIVAIILLQTLFFKFTGAEESVYIFSTPEMEPWGRIGSIAMAAARDGSAYRNTRRCNDWGALCSQFLRF